MIYIEYKDIESSTACPASCKIVTFYQRVTLKTFIRHRFNALSILAIFSTDRLVCCSDKTILLCGLLFFTNSYTFAQNIPETESTTKMNSIHNWDSTQLAALRSLWIGSLPALPIDPTNKYANNPKAAALGKKIFFDTRFSGNGKVSCSSCHDPKLYFTDGKAFSDGIGKTQRNSPSLLGISFSPWFFWDGRADSQWSQALEPLENSQEHGGNRNQYAHLINTISTYKNLYIEVFGPLADISDLHIFPANAGPVKDQSAASAWQKMTTENKNQITRIFVNIGKAIAAYERSLLPRAARFDQYVQALLNKNPIKITSTLTETEIKGLKLFIGKASCAICHSGPLFTNHDFKNIAVPPLKKLQRDQGRFDGVKKVKISEFNCLSIYSDANESACDELRYIRHTRDDTLASFKIPTLRNIEHTAPYMHAGQFKTLTEVLKHYQNRPKTNFGHNDLLLLELSDTEIIQLEAFLRTLTENEPHKLSK